MKPKIALQLYTLREALAEDFAGTLQRVAAMGYRAVETAFFPETYSVQAATQMIQETGLEIMAAHAELPLGEQQDAVLAQMRTLGCTRLIWHGWPQDPRYSSIDGIKALITQYNEANVIAQAYGLTMGIHNHWWECQLVDGIYPYQLLVNEMDPSIFFELDTYWAETAGLDALQVVAELGDRAPLLHIKDGPAMRHEPMVAVGNGNLDVAAIIGAGAGTVEWLIVELDECATDMFVAVERSYVYLVENGLAEA